MIQVKKRFSKKTLIASIGIALIVIVGGIITIAIIQNNKNSSTTDTADTPDYATVLPEGKTITELNGWDRVSPDGKDPVYAYNDSIDGVAISVSQQPLPPAFKDNTDSRVAELAKGDNATNAIQAGDTTFYIGTSAKGPQSVYLSKKGLLILIKSEAKIKDASWANYVASLK